MNEFPSYAIQYAFKDNTAQGSRLVPQYSLQLSFDSPAEAAKAQEICKTKCPFYFGKSNKNAVCTGVLAGEPVTVLVFDQKTFTAAPCGLASHLSQVSDVTTDF